MPPPRPEHLSTAYPLPVREADDAAIRRRREAAGVAPDAPRVGVALSGGGIRSATFCLGLFQSLARLGLVRRIDYLSTVSGGGYFGGFLGAMFNRAGADAQGVERDLGDNHSWPVSWLRDNGRYLAPNGSGDAWMAAAVALRNWVAVHAVILTGIFLVLCFGAFVRAELVTWAVTAPYWMKVENALWNYEIFGLWLSPWFVLPALVLVLVMIPLGSTYWLTQFTALMGLLRLAGGVVARPLRAMTNLEFAARLQAALSRGFMIGLLAAVVLSVYAIVDTLGQSLYYDWSMTGFAFPSLWASASAGGAALFGFASRIFLLLERMLGDRRSKVPLATLALVAAVVWLLLLVVAMAVAVCGVGWGWDLAWDGMTFRPIDQVGALAIATLVAAAASWFFSQTLGFVNLSSLQQVYADRLRRAYIGASNLRRRASDNHNATDLVSGDDIGLAAYQPHANGGPVHFINVTLNETISAKTGVERYDRKGVAMAVGPCGVSVGTGSHALWADRSCAGVDADAAKALTERPTRELVPVVHGTAPRYHALVGRVVDPAREVAPGGRSTTTVEALSIGRWVAISGAAFTTGIGAGTKLGLSLLLGLANIRLGYWWSSGTDHGWRPIGRRPGLRDSVDRVLTRLLPVQALLSNELLARFHGPARRYWYLSDGGHFENTACYELIRRRVPFIICSDAGQDPTYQFGDFATLVRMVRTDFGAEIEIVRRRAHALTDDPGTKYPMPRLEDIVHPGLLDVIGSPEDFPALDEKGGGGSAPSRASCHALLARVHYLDNDQFSWLLLIKPSLMGDESADVAQYRATHPLFPQEPTTDQFFDEAQWESYRKLGEHIGVELFTPPDAARPGWSPSLFAGPGGPDGTAWRG
jgi:hypothetical protein